jgi:O-methyltransferase involved in polyketide biosynthesis
MPRLATMADDAKPDNTAVRTALWRALHVLADAPPHVLDDTIGLQLADVGPDWRTRPDMSVQAVARTRAGIVARTRFVEDLLAELVEESDQEGLRQAERGARAQGTPFLSFFAPDEIVEVVRAAGLTTVRHVGADVTTARYFAGRTDGLRPSNGEEFVVATV